MSADTYWIGEPETAELIGDVSGTYRFRVTAKDPKDPAGRYTITLRSVEPATESTSPGCRRRRIRACLQEVGTTPEAQLKCSPM